MYIFVTIFVIYISILFVAILICLAKSSVYQLTLADFVADPIPQERDADAREGAGRWSAGGASGRRSARRPRGPRRRPRRHDHRQRDQAPPVSAVLEVLLQQSSAGPAYQGPHRREALQVQLLRPQVQATQPRATAHQATYR